MRKLAYLTVFAFLPLAAAGAAEQAKAPGQGADACTLVSQAEIEQTLGVKLTDGVASPSLQEAGVVSTCNYKTFESGLVAITIRRRPAKSEGTAPTDAKKQGVKQEHIAGLGRDALLTESSGMWNLSIFRGDYDLVNVMVMGSIDAKPASAAIEKLGRLVLERWK